MAYEKEATVNAAAAHAAVARESRIVSEKQKQGWLWLGFALAIGCGLIWQFFPLTDAGDRLQKLPTAGIGFGSAPQPLKPDEAAILGDVRVVRRSYQFGSDAVLLTVIDGTRNRHAVHDPFYCIRGSGWQIVSQNNLPIPGGEAKLIRMRKQNQETEALVWFSDAIHRYPSAGHYWMQTTLRRLTLGRSGPEPVLVTLQSATDHPVNWTKIISDHDWLFRF